jgi:DNA polymerase-3 subunit beta
MRIKANREHLLSAFQTAAMVAPARSPKPILQSVKLKVSGGNTELMATDTEISVRLDVEGVEAETDGEVVLPVSRFGAILRESTDETLALETDGNEIVVSGSRSKFRLPAENPDEFPEVATFDESKYHEVPARLMKELIRRTLFATDTESSRYALGGVLLVFDESKVTAVGTDGRRLAKMEGPAQSIEGHQTAEKATTIVPSRAMQLLERALSDNDAEIKVAARANDLIVKSPRATISARLVEGRFPKWEDVLAERPSMSQVDVSVGPLATAVRQAAIVTSQESRGINLCFDDGTLVLSGNTAEVGESRIEVPVAFNQEKIQLSLDHRFLSDYLKVLDADKSVAMKVLDNDSPAIFHTDDGYSYVVMPLSREGR